MMNGCGRVLQFGRNTLEITDFKPLIRVIWGISGVPLPDTITGSRYAGKGTKTKAKEHKTVDTLLRSEGQHGQ